MGLYGTSRHDATSAVCWVAMEQPDWMARVGMGIAGEIRRHRLSAGMSAQQLSDACAALGANIPRTVISNIENGRRTNVSVAEVLVFARALGVPPIALIFPAGYVAEVEYMPGRRTDVAQAIDWFAGEIGINEKTRLADLPRQEWALTVAREHRRLERRITSIYRSIWEEGTQLGFEATGPEIDSARQHAHTLELKLKALREDMVRRGLTPPKTHLKVDDLTAPNPESQAASGPWLYTDEPPF